MDFSQGFSTPAWSVGSGFCAANPRDVLLVVGEEIIEAPMADRSRHHEAWPYRSLLKDYSRRGARWTAAPKPQLTDALFDPNYRIPEPGEDIRYVLTEHEPVFDAAEFARCGRDLFTQLSHATNRFGIEWLHEKGTGALYLTDFNARPFSSIGHLADCGLNLPLLAYHELATGERPSVDLHPRLEPRHWTDFNRDLRSFRESRRRHGQTWRDFAASVLRCTSFAYFDVRDPGPWLRRSVSLLETLIGHVGRR